MSNPTIFISYSHEDERWKQRLTTQLAVLESEGILEAWDDRRIGAGEDWYDQIQQAMDRACVAILLISAEFLTSNFVRREEIPKLLQRREEEGLRVVPVILKPCPWKHVRWLARMQARPKDGRPLSAGDDHQIEADLAGIAEEVAEITMRAAGPADTQGRVLIAPEKISLAKLPSTSPDLFGRDDELAILDAAWTDPNTNIVSFVAFGGVGKTALVNKWLLQVGQDNYRGAERVYGYSFYSQGAREGAQVSADEFIAAALTWFGDDDPARGLPWDKGERLASLVSRQRTLLVLDGVEPLQYPPGEMEGRLKDPGLQSLLRELARHNPGLCIVTTRLAVDDLKDFVGTSVKRISLEDLSPDAGAALLENLRVKEAPDELRQASVEFEGHALALTLLGSYLATVYQGDIRQRGKIAKLTKEKKQGRHARRVMAAYEKWFRDKPEADILRIMGLFDRPAEPAAIDAVRADPPIKGLTSRLHGISHDDWQFALANLRAAKLLGDSSTQDPGTIDCHPLVREHFAERLKTSSPDAWTEGHDRLYLYYRSSGKEFPDTIEEMAPLYAAVAHGCRAGRHQDVLEEVYWPRILGGREDFSLRYLGSASGDLAALSGFFDVPWQKPASALGEFVREFVLFKAGVYLLAVGRALEAAQPMKACLEGAIAKEDWENASQHAWFLSEIYLNLGDLAQALHYAREGVRLGDLSGYGFERMNMRAAVAAVTHQMGRLDEAEASFRQAEEMQKTKYPGHPMLYSVWNFKYCDLLMDQRESHRVRTRVRETLRTIGGQGDLLDFALNRLLLGRAELLHALQDNSGSLSRAERVMEQAVEELQHAGRQDHVPRGLLARAELGRLQRRFERARRDVDEAATIAERGEMGLYRADCHLEYARLHLATGDEKQARQHVAKAKEMIEQMGYHRRDPEVLLVTAELQLADGDQEAARETVAAAGKRIDEMGCHRWDIDVRELQERLE